MLIISQAKIVIFYGVVKKWIPSGGGGQKKNPALGGAFLVWGLVVALYIVAISDQAVGVVRQSSPIGDWVYCL